MKLLTGILVTILLLNNFYRITTIALNMRHWNLNNFQSEKSIDAAVTKYYERKTFMMSIGIYLEYSRLWQNYVMDFLTDALRHSKLMKYEIFTKSSTPEESLPKVSYHNLWYVDSYKGFSSLLISVKNYNNKYMGEYFVVMETAQSLNRDREVQSILEKSFQLNIVDIVVAVYVKNSTFKMYSYEIFSPHHCRQVKVEQVNVFKKGRFQNDEIFPYKFNNFYNCPITMYIRNTSLFFRFNLTEDGTRINAIEGVEANMLRVMSKKLNFKLNMYYNPHDTIGQVFPNGTAVGPFRFLNENKVDVLFGYYDYPWRNNYFGKSGSYAFMPLVMIVSEHNKRQFHGIWLIKPFGGMTWLILGLLSLLILTLVQLAHYYLARSVTWIDIVGLVLGNSRPLHIQSYITKFSFSVCIFGGMILCATFQGRLYNAFNSGNILKITCIQELIAANYTFLLRTSFDNDLIHSLHIPPKQIRFLDVADDYLIYDMMHKYTTGVATLTNYWDFQMYIESKKYYNEFDIIPMVVILNQICAYMRKHSYLIEPVNRLIFSLQYAGILNKWMEDLTNVDKTNDIELNAKHNFSPIPLPLTFIKLRIVFVGLIFFHLISILIFLGEFMVNEWNNIINKLKGCKILKNKN